MGKKILLITSSFEEISLITASSKKKKGFKVDKNSHYPLGLAYLHSYLESKGYKVNTLSLNNYNYTDCFNIVKNEIKNIDPDYVCFQVLTANRVSSYQLIKYIHSIYPNKIIIAGGIHATIMYKQLARMFPYVIIVIGEGEITLYELIKELSKNKPRIEKINGIAYTKKNKLIITKPRKLISDLDILPFPRHELFFKDSDRTVGDILTMRGCPFRCSFCCLDKISGGIVRKRSVENVINEILWMINQFPQMDTVWVHDDSFLLDNQRVIKFCKEVVKRKIKINFICSARVKPISMALIREMERAHFTLVLLGVESGSEDLLRKCHKGITKKDIINTVELFSKSNINISTFLIVGLPGENKRTIKETSDFVKQLQKIKYFYYSEDGAILTVYPGTEIYETAKQNKVLNDDYWLSDKPTPLYEVENTKEELFAFKEYLLNNISLNRLFSLQGFIKQYMMIPYIIKYVLNNKELVFKYRKLILNKLFNK